jgi:uncharacterized damage-inducible protein DinB
MPLYDLLLPEFDQEIQKTRLTLERLPEDKPDFKPHEKSTPLVKLANHTAGLPAFLSLMLTTEGADMMAPKGEKTVPAATNAERLSSFDAAAKMARAQLADTADRAMHESWKLCAGDRTIFNGSRYHAVRGMFFNHMIHHRAQLGIYLRLNDCPVPSIYGPSADES